MARSFSSGAYNEADAGGVEEICWYILMLTVGSSFFWGWESAFAQSGQDVRMISKALAVKQLTVSSRTGRPLSPTHSPLQFWTNSLASPRSLWFACPGTSLASVHTQACQGARAGSEQMSVSPRTGSEIPR